MDEIDEQKELDEYRAGCLALAPEERIAEMRRLSRRLILLDPRNPRSPRIEPVITILRDAV